jgi:hypothetical protein
MRSLAHILVSIALVATFSGVIAAHSQNGPSPYSQIRVAKTVYLDNQSGSDAVGREALAQLKKWGEFQIVNDRTQANLIFVLSADPAKGGNIIFSAGQTGTVQDGRVEEDQVPTYNKQAPVRYLYLTVVDSKNGEKLWSDSHKWGGLLTGFNSAGARLVKKLEKEVKK